MQVGRWLPLFVLGGAPVPSKLHAQSLDETAATRSACSDGTENVLTKAQRGRGDAGVLAAHNSLIQTIQKLARAGEAASYDGLRQLTQARLHRQLLESANATGGVP